MKTMKRLFALALALVMVMGLATTAFAHDVTVNFDNKHTPAAEHTLEAYQIFKGVYEFDTTTGKEILKDVDWGENVNGTDLLKALMGEVEGVDCPLFKAALAEHKTAKEAELKVTNYVLDADDVAEILAKKSTATNTTWVAEFARTANKYLKKDPAPAVAVGNDTNTTDDVYSTEYTFKGLDDGYYLIKDQDGSLDNTAETYTNLSMRIVGADEFTIKNGTVEVDKKIMLPTGELVESALSDMNGKPVEFEIVGTIPWNFDRFAEFAYEFVDTMTPGLTYTENSLKVYYQNGLNAAVEFPVKTTKVDPTYTVTVGDYSKTEGTKINVVFGDLVAINKDLSNVINDQTKIIVKYSATVNENAVVGGNGNENMVHLEYDNDPYSDSKGKTPDDSVWVFTMKMNNTKVDTDTADSLAGAKFVLSRQRTDTVTSKVVTEYLALDANGNVSNWIANAEIDTLLAGNVGKALNAAQQESITDAGITLLTSSAEGKFNVIGIKPGSYKMQEVQAPTGYNILEEVLTLNMYGETVIENGVAKLINVYSDINSIERVSGNAEAGSVDFTVENGAGAVLPETGGIGTTIFYVLGGALAVAAVVLLITKKRMAVEE